MVHLLQKALAVSLAMLALAPDSVWAEKGMSSKQSGKGKRGKKGRRTLTLEVTNLSVRQPFAPFFVMSHDGTVPPLFTFGANASVPLATLAETGSPAELVDMYSAYLGSGAGEVKAFADGFPFMGGQSATFDVTVSDRYPYVTIASMAIHTNDCFVAVNGMRLNSGDTHFLPGLDAGSEANDELCANIPGPACMGGMGRSTENAEGFVHVHPGFHGVGDLAENLYDWRNPMAVVKVM